MRKAIAGAPSALNFESMQVHSHRACTKPQIHACLSNYMGDIIILKLSNCGELIKDLFTNDRAQLFNIREP